MTQTQMLIDKMHGGDVSVIIENVKASTPILVLNAIIAGVKLSLTDESFLAGVKAATQSNTVLLGVPLCKVAVAALHLLGVKKYTGNDTIISSLIETNFQL